MQCCRLLLLNVKDYESAIREGLLDREVEFTIATSEEEALHLVQDGCYTALLWEIANITQEHIEFIQKIRKLAQEMPILMVAQQDTLDMSIELFALGVFSVLRKSSNPVELLELLQAALDIVAKKDGLQILSASPSWIEVRIPAQTCYIPRLSSWVSKWILGFSERDTQRLIFAFRELVQNAIEHGSHFCADKNVNIRYIISKKFISFQIDDEGPGFNLSEIPHAAVGKRRNSAMEVMMYRKKIGMRPGGLGIASIQSIADELIYNEKGNSVIIIKYLTDTDTPSVEKL